MYIDKKKKMVDNICYSLCVGWWTSGHYGIIWIAFPGNSSKLPWRTVLWYLWDRMLLRRKYRFCFCTSFKMQFKMASDRLPVIQILDDFVDWHGVIFKMASDRLPVIQILEDFVDWHEVFSHIWNKHDALEWKYTNMQKHPGS
jgi:hypothetical protein